MLQVYTGNGKGKTTAALGLIARSLGNGNRVCLIQFMKKNFPYGEIEFFTKQENIKIIQTGTAELVDPNKPNEIDFIEAEKGYQAAKKTLQSNQYDLVVLDEINVAVKWNLLKLEKQLELINIPTEAEIIMTGRYAADEVITKADLVTEMKEIKHYYNSGIVARKGIEF